MNTLGTKSGASVRDPIAVSIEGFLNHEAAQGRGELHLNHEDRGVRVSFAGVTVQAENYDIAFVRLARMLLDDARYFDALADLLREPMLATV